MIQQQIKSFKNMNKEKEIAPEIETVTNELVQVISSFTGEQINTVPFEGSWTPGQVVDHLMKSAERLTKNIYGATIGTERKPDEKIEIIASIFLNFSSKLNSPDFIIPEKMDHDKKKLIDRVITTMAKVAEGAKTLQLSETCLDFELPRLGKLTRLEWSYFILYHTQRHIRQLKNIYQKLNNISEPTAG
jgi:hypothetical protein